MKVAGHVRVPGDKSITHRAFFAAALAQGTSWVEGALTSRDARSTAALLRRLGADVSPLRRGARVRVGGLGRLLEPPDALHCGNSGTTARLLLGILAAHPFRATVTGDTSLRRRPMRRVTVPLTEMGATFVEHNNDGLPLSVTGGPLQPLTHRQQVSSAQVKGALLFAGLAGGVSVDLIEPSGGSRDHTERLFRGLGLTVETVRGGEWIHYRPTGGVVPFELSIPGDISSAAFLVGAALLAEGGELSLEDVGLNPTRTGFLEVVRRMGGEGSVHTEPSRMALEEPVGTLVARPSPLSSTEVDAAEIPSLIDEVPLLAILASRAEGTTVFREVGELRVKESNRLELLAANLRAIGSDAEVRGNDLYVTGGAAPPVGRIRTAGDHRLAMAFAVLGTVPAARVM
ncbi:MAG: 3-phosphoshikimate 1-carboxyvinyltransferase, partial [Gemmatimonadales bacterium]|nr:3-phosphoshikimate 1-carboxyvinyltransferase [Gemmatimonadales bacterium]